MASRHSPASTDVIVTNDTLCSLNGQECASLMGQCFEVLRPGGLLVLNVPALKAFGGIHDLSVGIQHRFSRSDVLSLIDLRKFRVVRELYWPFLLSPLIYCVRLWQRMKMRLTRDFEIRSDIDLPSPWLNRILGTIIQSEDRWLRARPFGSSLFVVLKKNMQ